MSKINLKDLIEKKLKIITKDGRSAEGVCFAIEKKEEKFWFRINNGMEMLIPQNEVVIEFL